ncbi:MAG: helix-turn-helix domain-containing protein [Parcubacteria group bacterium]|jgi:sugar-specific transcriptional regulator TrmB
MEETKNIYQSLYTPLKELGLSDLEANAYMVSLKLGPSTISEIAKNLHIARPNVYKVIQELEGKGLAKLSAKKSYARNFVVESPTVVLDMFRQKKKEDQFKESELAMAMPDLLANYQQGLMPSKVKVFQGKEDFKKIFFNILEEADRKIWFCGSAQDFIGFVSWSDEKRWIKQRMKKNIFINSLLLPSDEAHSLQKTDADELREIRIMKGFYPFSTSFQLFANKVIFWQPLAPLAIVIEDKYLVEMMESIVDKLWEEAQ